MKKLFLTLGIILFFSFESFAQSRLMITRDADVSEEQAREIVDIIEALAERFKNDLDIPEILEIKIQRQSATFGYRIAHPEAEGTLILPLQWDTFWGTSLSFEHLPPVIVHEYGHALFDVYMNKELPIWVHIDAWLAKRRKLEDYREKLETQLWTFEDAPIHALMSKIALLSKNMDILDQKIEETNLMTLSRAYNELFADVIAVLYYKDGAILSDMFSIAAAPFEEEEKKFPVYVRNFTLEHTPEWIEAAPKKNSHFFAYAYGAPSRSYLWKHYLSQPEVQKNPGRFLKGLLKSIRNEIERRLNEKQMQISVADFNQRLQAELDHILKNN